MSFFAGRTTILATLLATVAAGNVTGLFARPAAPGVGERSAADGSALWQNALTDHQLANWVEQCVQQWPLTAAERRVEEIGWAKDIREAERLAKKHNRPIFLFIYDGRMAIGRC